MRRVAIIVLAAALSSACGNESPVTPKPDAGATAACLDNPTDLARPPGDTLPCELLPPGFVPKGD